MEEESTIPQLVDNVREGKLSRRQLTKMLAILGVSTAGIAAIVAQATRPATPTPTAPPPPSPDPQEIQHLQQHDQHLANQAQGNLEQLHHDYAEHAIVEDSLYDAPLIGRAAIMARKGTGMTAVKNAQINVTNRVVKGNQVTVEWVATGQHTGDLPGLPATNRSYVLHGVTVVVREQGKIVREALYYDAADFRRQLSQPGLSTEI
jgi:steroid delta-isomerase-like uncharacterized protein